MATRNFFSEQNPEGKGLQDRLTAVGLYPTVQRELLGRGEQLQELLKIVQSLKQANEHCVVFCTG
jgi:hypothetical protein